MAIASLQDLTFRLNRAGGGLVNPIVFSRIGTGMMEGRANMFGYKTGKVDLLDKHQDFLHTLFTNVLQEDSLSTVRFLGRADRKNRSGNAAVNQKVSDDRAQRAENFMRTETGLQSVYLGLQFGNAEHLLANDVFGVVELRLDAVGHGHGRIISCR